MKWRWLIYLTYVWYHTSLFFILTYIFLKKKIRCFNILMPLMRTRSPFYLTILASMLSTILFSILSDSQSQLRLLSENHNQDGRGIYLFIFVPPLSVCGKKKYIPTKKNKSHLKDLLMYTVLPDREENTTLRESHKIDVSASLWIS